MGVPQIYPVPPSAEKAGDTDRFISTWLKHQKRENLVVATKVRCSIGIAIIQGGKESMCLDPARLSYSGHDDVISCCINSSAHYHAALGLDDAPLHVVVRLQAQTRTSSTFGRLRCSPRPTLNTFTTASPLLMPSLMENWEDSATVVVQSC